MKSNGVIVKPLLTEKTTKAAAGSVYAFVVNENATKHQIASLLEGMYKVKVASVRILMRKGKIKRAGRAMKEKQMPNIKIAYVSVKEGKIDLFPQA
jgi:large subunit ribosomal protein L23